MYYGNGTPRTRYSVDDKLMPPRNRYMVDERVIFERLWRGALYQALGSKAPPLRAITQRKTCCCHCHCMDSPEINAHHHHHHHPPPQPQPQIQCVPKKTMRSVVRYDHIYLYYLIFIFYK